MKKLSMAEYQKIRTWMFRNSRPLDFLRWLYYFESGDKSAVLSVLSSYQNDDGGFGHALEADSWNPLSSPLHTTAAISILHEINHYDESDPIIKGILSFLEKDSSFENRGWIQKIPSNNDYPHAPWWTYDKDKIGGFHSEWEYNPTAIIIGFILRVMKQKDTKFYKTCLRIAHEAIEKLLTVDSMEPHELGGFCTLFSYLKKTKTTDNFDFLVIGKKLQNLVSQSIERDLSKWTGYVTKPSSFIDSPDNMFYSDNQEIMDCELDYIINSRNKDGVWDISWSWGAYEKEFAISENWWKSNLAILNLKLLKNFKRIQ